MTLPTFTPGINISATGGSNASGTGMATASDVQRYAGTRDKAPGQGQGKFDELGFPGVLNFGGYIQAAYQRELYWPTVFPLYNRLRRSDPEVSVVRQIFSAVAGDLKFEWKGPEEGATDDDARALEFAEGALTDLDGGIEQFRDTLVSHVPFMGWGWWELVPGLRRKNWAPPDKDGEPDEWRSKFDDGLTGFRRLAFRDHSSFLAWDISTATGKLLGMQQLAMPHPIRVLPLANSVHMTFGDTSSPEGLTPLESLWRLERIKYGLEIVQGIGYEHAAGYLNVTKTSTGEITTTDTANIRKAARAILTAQEGNYAAWPNGFTGKVEDVNFTAGQHIMEAIRYYGLLKLALFNAQWVGMSSITDKGSYSALHDASSTWMVFFNAMMAGFARQLDLQLGARLFEYNKNSFPKMTERPHLTITPVEKFIELDKLGSLWTAIKDTMPVGEADFLALRRKTGFLPEEVPTGADVYTKPAPGLPGSTPPAQPSATMPLSGEALDAAEQAAAEDIYNPAVSGFSRKAAAMTMAPQSLTQLQDGFGATVAHYRMAVYNAVADYLLRDGSSATAPKSAVGQAVLTVFPDVFYAAYRSGGAETVEPDDDAWLTARENAEVANVAGLFVVLKGLKDEKLPPGELVAEANLRADGYADALKGVWAEGLLRGQKNKMLTMVGVDGKDMCPDCARLKGKRFSARKWLRIGIPGVPGNGYKCGGWKCRHGLQDDGGAMWTMAA